MYGIDNTFLSYGLSKEEYITLRRRYNTSIRTNFPHIKHLNTDEFTDLLAVPAFMVIIRFDNLSDEQLEDFNECYKDFDSKILSLDEPKFDVDFEYQQGTLKELLDTAEDFIIRQNKKHPHMYTKSETLDFLAYVHKVAQNDILLCFDPYQGENFREMADIIRNEVSPNAIYEKIGKSKTTADSEFDGIYFREDCYDYLISQGFNHTDSYKLMETIRRGMYHNPKYQHFKDRLSDEFIKWAIDMRFLPSRNHIFSALAKEYDDYQLDNLD